MADEKKRIIELAAVQNISNDDYIAMDSEDGGTKKIKAAYFTGSGDEVHWGAIQGDIGDQTDLNNALTAITGNAVFVDADGKFYVNS